MGQRSWFVRLLHALLHDWWIVVGCIAVAVVVAVGANLSYETTYEGRAVVNVDVTTIASNARLPKPDAVVVEVKSAAFAEDLASTMGLDAGELRGGLNAYTSGNPQNKVTVTFTHVDKAVALDVSDKAGALAVEAALDLMEPELKRQRALVEESYATIEILGSLEPTVAAYSIWAIRRNLIIDEANVSAMEEAYAYAGKSTAEASSRRTRLLNAGVAGVVLGLVAGILLVAARDYLRRRGETVDA
ncbi:MAG: hypothetical protein OEV43_05345 [Coriobacteriia bacterium]|nr:hypothetical protein [Coriobacteriia bacterium]